MSGALGSTLDHDFYTKFNNPGFLFSTFDEEIIIKYVPKQEKKIFFLDHCSSKASALLHTASTCFESRTKFFLFFPGPTMSIEHFSTLPDFFLLSVAECGCP